MFCVKLVINPSSQSSIMFSIDLERLMARLFSLLSGRPLSILHTGVVFPLSFPHNAEMDEKSLYLGAGRVTMVGVNTGESLYWAFEMENEGAGAHRGRGEWHSAW